MIEDKLFEDCYRIADKYETNLLQVLMQYSSIEIDYKRKMVDVPYDVLIRETEVYFKEELDKQ